MKEITALLLLLVASCPVYAADEVYFSPHGQVTQIIVEKISVARKSIHVATYSFTSKPIAEALALAKFRGVDVEIVADFKESNRRNSLVKYVEDRGIPTHRDSRHKIMHNKFMIFDGVLIETGSFNYTQGAECCNAENALFLHNPSLASAYEVEWKKLFDRAR